jgi:Zn-dependent peptidase ImmA (M78 family)
MSYAELHGRCQGLQPYIRRGTIYQHVLDIKGIERVVHVRMGLDTSSCRGLYLSARNTDHPFVRQNGGHVIITARGLSPLWDRFIFIKELMHIFDDPAEATDNGDAFERLLSELTNQTSDARWSPQMEAELDCFWMAAAVICPRQTRLELKARYEADPSTLNVIAEEIGMPAHSVAHLLSPYFDVAMQKIIGQ